MVVVAWSFSKVMSALLMLRFSGSFTFIIKESPHKVIGE